MAESLEQTTQLDPTGAVFPTLPKDARWEERILFFLKELPAWCIILILLLFLVTIWLRTASGQIESYVGQALAALLTAVVTNRNRAIQNTDNSTQIKTDSVQAENVEKASTETGDITAGQLGSAEKENEENG